MRVYWMHLAFRPTYCPPSATATANLITNAAHIVQLPIHPAEQKDDTLNVQSPTVGL